MAEAKKVGQQMQKPSTSRLQTQNHYVSKSYKPKFVCSKPYDRTSNTFSRRPFLGQVRGIFGEETTMLPIGKDSNKPGR